MTPAFFDTECFPNYWLLKFKADQMYTFTLSNIRDSLPLFNSHTVVSFNGIGYDCPIIACALAGFTCEQLKRTSDQIILYNQPSWKVNLLKWAPPNHIDLMNVIPGQGGQKQFAGRIHHKQIQDLPFDPDTVLTPMQIQEVNRYCELDIEVLEALYNEMHPQLEQRRVMSVRYGLDLMSKSDAQIAEAVIKYRCEQVTGQPIGKPPIPNLSTRFSYTSPPFIQSKLLDGLTFGYDLTMPEELKHLTVTIGATTYRLGMGGLHSQEQKLTAYSSESDILRDADVISYYPQLILNSGQYPPLLGPAFQHVYQSIKDERIEQKRKNNLIESQGLKIQINGAFGKMGNPYSILFAPEMLIHTTLTGQLALLMLIEWHEAVGIPVLSANTDGLVIRCPKERIHESNLLIAAWELQTGLQMEITEYSSIHLRDVNNYIAITTDRKVKRKGKFGPAGLAQMKNPDTEICVDAVIAYLTHNTPIEQTIHTCRDITKFVKIQKVKGGAVKNNHYLGKVVRWYYGVNSPEPIVYQSNRNKVGRSEGAIPCMILPDTLPTNIDYAWYVREADTLLSSLSRKGELF